MQKVLLRDGTTFRVSCWSCRRTMTACASFIPSSRVKTRRAWCLRPRRRLLRRAGTERAEWSGALGCEAAHLDDAIVIRAFVRGWSCGVKNHPGNAEGE